MDEQNIQHDDASQDDARENTTREDDSPIYTAADKDYAFNGNTSPDGSGYTTPTGGHGYVYGYTSDPRPDPGKSRRIAIISLVAVLVVVLMVGCVMLGSLLSRESYTGAEETATATDSDTDTPTGSGVFIVMDPNETSGESTSEGTTDTAPETQKPIGQYTDQETRLIEEEQTNEDGVIQITSPIPSNSVITKKTPIRTDADGDGKADVETDSAGNVLTSVGTNGLSAATVVYRVADSVVEITTETIVRSEWIGQYVTSGAGSGVIISADGFIITNNHVIEDADSIVVTLTDGTKYEARLIGTDEESDIALLWIDAADRSLTVATMGASFDLVVGEQILAIGNPLGSLGGTVTEGIISATAREISIEGTDMTLLQISAPINPGNSGGGLFNMAGELIGIVNAKCSSDDVEGLGFAIPIDTAYEIICQLYEYGYVRGRVTLGVKVAELTQSQAIQAFHTTVAGVYVTESATADIEYGDLIYAVDGIEVSTYSEIRSILKTKQVGESVELLLYRSNGRMLEPVTVTVQLKEYKPDSSRDAA